MTGDVTTAGTGKTEDALIVVAHIHVEKVGDGLSVVSIGDGALVGGEVVGD